MKIKLLPPHLANQIAAGEVVERPASVVKELVENALDAGARRIAIAIELGGKKSLRVEDDGEGMAPEDARLAIERHATSKIAAADDLAAIRTLGFRGEALPSIASVSHFTLRTRARGSASGTEIRVNGGTVSSEREVGAPEGTAIEVEDLFYNLPARRKFLKSDTAEAAQISRLVSQLALGYPEVGFSLTSGGRRLLACPPAVGPHERFFQLFGERPDLIEIRKEAGGIAIQGYVAALRDQGPVAGRAERLRQPPHRQGPDDRARHHRGVQRRDDQGAEPRGSPVSARFQPTASTSTCIRRRPRSVFWSSRSCTRCCGARSARRSDRAARRNCSSPPFAPRPEEPRPMSIPGVLAGATVAKPLVHGAVGRRVLRISGGSWGPRFDGAVPSEVAAAPQASVEIRPMIPLGQFRDTFIIAIDDEGVAIIDQHVAHERVLFERVMETLTTARLESQRLLTPILIEMSPAERHALAQHGATLERFGLEIEEFGGDSVRLSAVPAILDPRRV